MNQEKRTKYYFSPLDKPAGFSGFERYGIRKLLNKLSGKSASPAISLGQSFESRKNSITFMRFALAVMVIFTHSFDLGGYGPDPFKTFFHVSLSTIGVHGFFALSGYLIARSFMRNPSLPVFLRNRFLRIFPGYWACLLITAFIMLPAVYFYDHGKIYPAWSFANNPFFDYLKGNFFLKINQPGVADIFSGNPYQDAVNGSLWTLLPEFICYLMIAVFGLANLLSRKMTMVFIFLCLFAVSVLREPITAVTAESVYAGKALYLVRLAELFVYFLSGAILFFYAGRVPGGGILPVAATLGLCLSLYFHCYEWVAPLVLPYLLLLLSIRLPLAGFDRLGDYSYGLYIYAFPVQQIIAFMNPGIYSPWGFFLVSVAATLPLAVFSWKCVEAPCLALKRSFGLFEQRVRHYDIQR